MTAWHGGRPHTHDGTSRRQPGPHDIASAAGVTRRHPIREEGHERRDSKGAGPQALAHRAGPGEGAGARPRAARRALPVLREGARGEGRRRRREGRVGLQGALLVQRRGSRGGGVAPRGGRAPGAGPRGPPRTVRDRPPLPIGAPHGRGVRVVRDGVPPRRRQRPLHPRRDRRGQDVQRRRHRGPAPPR